MRPTRTLYRALAALLLPMLALLAFTSTADAKPRSGASSSGGGNPNEECPAGSVLIAKFNYEGGSYAFEKPAGNEGVVTITNGTSTGGSWSSSQPISAVIVKGGAGPVATKTVSYDPPATSGSFDNVGLLNNGGRTPAVSNVQFCGPESPPPPPPPSYCINAVKVELFDLGSQIGAVITVVNSDGSSAAGASLTVAWTTPDGALPPVNVVVGPDGAATSTIPQGADGTYTAAVTAASDARGASLCAAVADSISLLGGCCLEANIVNLAVSGGTLTAQVAVAYTDGYVPDNVDVTVTVTTPSGPITLRANTQADGTVDNIATFTIPAGGPGVYSAEVTGADDFVGTPLCSSDEASIEVR